MTDHETIAQRTCKRKRNAATNNPIPPPHPYNEEITHPTKKTNKKKRKHITIEPEEETSDTDTPDEQQENENDKNKLDETKQKRQNGNTRNEKDTPQTKTVTKTKNKKQTNINAYYKNTIKPLTNTKARQLNTTIPTPTISTYNITSLSAYATPYTDAHKRQQRVIADIKHLANNSDIIFLQETKLDAHETHTILHNVLPNWRFHYNNHPENTGKHDTHRAGTLIATSPMINNNYTIQKDIIHEDASGHIQSIKLMGKSKPNKPTPLPLRIVNVYLPTGQDHHERRADQLEYLLALPSDCHIILAGDFNFVENADDTTNYTDYHHLNDRARQSWDQLLTKHGLWEVQQPIHTQHALNQDDPRTSRIDRFYINHTEADSTIHTPSTTITNTPHSSIRTINKSHPPNHHRLSTHCALTLSFHDTTNTHHTYKLPPWITQTQSFKKHFCDIWFASTPSSDAFAEEIRFKQTAKKAHKLFKQDKENFEKGSQAAICTLTAAISLLRCITCNKTDPTRIRNIKRDFPALAALAKGDNPDPNPLRAHIATLIETGTPSGALTSPGRTDTERSEGEAIFRATNRTRQPLDQVTTILPTTKTHLTHLKEKAKDDHTTNPKEQAQILKKFWGKIWAKRPDAPAKQEIDEYLKTYDKYIDEEHAPELPSREDIANQIKKAKNTACGPDGMPFALYRNLLPISTTIIYDIISSMAKGTPPPREFNMGETCFFPKDNSYTVDRTRPITLNNVSNRITAAIVAEKIMPAIDSIIDTRQRGFIKGRSGDDNIHEITNKFYDNLNNQTPHFFLFIDTAKAFDSVDHDYLFAVINKIGMPMWVTRIIRGLMTNVAVRPSLKGKIRTKIPIKRGVKQGCPLSPLLFLIAYDPLLRNIQNIPKAIPWSFADDAAIGHPTMKGITEVTEKIDTFATISGFGVNRDKSMVLHTLPPTKTDKQLLRKTKWEGLAFANKTTYLGVLMGFNIDTKHIYAKAMKEFANRADRFASALTHSSLNNRILIFNTYLHPLFSYLSRYYILPYRSIGKEARRIISHKIISFNGGAFKYIHLITPLNRFGFARPLRDLWATNVADLACQFDYTSLTLSPEPIKGEHIAILPGKEYINDGGREWNGLKPEDHIACAALELVNDHLPHDPNTYDITPLDTSKYKNPIKKLRQKIYKIALEAYEHKHEANITEKLENMKIFTPNCAQNHIRHGPNIIKTLPPHIRNHQKLITFHALATDTRREKAMHVTPRGPPDNPHPCFFCQNDKDSQQHIYTDCRPVTRARKSFGRMTDITLHNSPLHHCLANKAAPKDTDSDKTKKDTQYYERRTNATIIFNYAVWHVRTHYARTKIDILPQDIYENKIKNTAINLWNKHAPPQWRTTNSLTPPDMAILANGIFGNASTRTEKQKKEAQIYTRKIISSIPNTHYIAYTDGSAKINKRTRDDDGPPRATRTGPCGAGAYLKPPPHTNKKEQFLSTAIKAGTNNIGELYAIGLAIEAFENTSPPGASLTILTDSRLATLLIEHNAHANTNTELVRAVRAKYWHAKHTRNIIIRWIPAHIGTIGNETADSLAEEGTRRAALPNQGLSPTNMNTRIANKTFITDPPEHPNTLKRKRDPPSQKPTNKTHKRARSLRQSQINFTKLPSKKAPT